MQKLYKRILCSVILELSGGINHLFAPEQEHFTDKELRRHIQDVDKRRSKYYQFFTGQTWGEKLNYDLCINTSGANIEDLVKVIAKLVK